MGGVPCIRGYRPPVATVVGMIAEGMDREEVLEEYSELEKEDIQEALRFAANTLKERKAPAAFLKTSRRFYLGDKTKRYSH